MTLTKQIEELIKQNSGVNLDEAFERYFSEDNDRIKEINDEIEEQFDQIKEAIGYGDATWGFIDSNVEEIQSLQSELKALERRQHIVRDFINSVKNNKEL